MLSVQGCFLSEVLPEEKQKKKGTKNPEPPVAVPLVPKPQTLAAARLMRRLSIDLTGSLPNQKDVDLLAADASKYFIVAERLLNSSVAAVNISQLHQRMWKMRSDRLPDLERFIDEGDSFLNQHLTESMRSLIVTEPLQFIRFQYEHNLPLSAVFTASYSYSTSELLDLWGTTSSGIPWTGQNWHFSEYSDGRPDSGIIGSPAFLATIDSRGLGKKGYDILSRFNCLNMENENIHLFYHLSPDEMLTDFSTLSVTKRNCAECHRPIENANLALKQFGSGNTFDDWKSYTNPETEIEGVYNGKNFTGAQGWLNAFKNDPRIHRCAAQRLVGALNQRAYGQYDTAAISIGLTRYLDRNESLKELVRSIVFSEEYRFDTVGPAITGEYLRKSSGVRNLRRHQWKSILSSMHPGLSDLEYPEALDPGLDEVLDNEDMVPTGQYWASIDRLVRSAAEKIVEDELSDSSIAITRRVFTALADGSSFGVETESIYYQMRLLWLKFTGEILENDFVTYTALQTLWAANKPEESEENFRQAWRVTLIAMLSHPRFINY